MPKGKVDSKEKRREWKSLTRRGPITGGGSTETIIKSMYPESEKKNIQKRLNKLPKEQFYDGQLRCPICRSLMWAGRKGYYGCNYTCIKCLQEFELKNIERGDY